MWKHHLWQSIFGFSLSVQQPKLPNNSKIIDSLVASICNFWVPLLLVCLVSNSVFRQFVGSTSFTSNMNNFFRFGYHRFEDHIWAHTNSVKRGFTIIYLTYLSYVMSLFLQTYSKFSGSQKSQEDLSHQASVVLMRLSPLKRNIFVQNRN